MYTISNQEYRCVFSPKDYDATVAFYADTLEPPLMGGWDRGPEDVSTKPLGHRGFSVRDPDGIESATFSHAEVARNAGGPT